jgi:hypothetical protein
MSTEVSQLYSQDKYAEAAPIAERYAALVREKRGHKHTEYATAIGWLTRVCPAEGRYAETEPLHKRTIAIDEGAGARGPERRPQPHQPRRTLGEASSAGRRGLGMKEAAN